MASFDSLSGIASLNLHLTHRQHSSILIINTRRRHRHPASTTSISIPRRQSSPTLAPRNTKLTDFRKISRTLQLDSTMDNSPLSKLPPELRNRTYELAMVRQDPVQFGRRKDDDYKSTTLPLIAEYRRKTWAMSSEERAEDLRNPPLRTRLALTETCKQARAESLPIFLNGNQFLLIFFRSWAGTARTTLAGVEDAACLYQNWLELFGTYSRNIRYMTINLGLMSRFLNDMNSRSTEALKTAFKRYTNISKQFGFQPKLLLEFTVGELPEIRVNFGVHSGAEVEAQVDKEFDDLRAKFNQPWRAARLAGAEKQKPVIEANVKRLVQALEDDDGWAWAP